MMVPRLGEKIWRACMTRSHEDRGTGNALADTVAPVEYAVAVDRYLAAAVLSDGSRRVYKISLTGWSWPLVGERPPTDRARRGAVPPVVPLALLDSEHAAGRIAVAVAERERAVGPRTVNRELSALRGAIAWWQGWGWISGDPTDGLRHRTGMPAVLPPLTGRQLAALWRCGAGLREQALWRLLRDSGAAAPAVLALDAADLDLARGRVRPAAWRRATGPGPAASFGAATAEMLGWLLAGRRHGPVFRTDRRAAAGTDQADICPLTGRARMSYRRAAEIFSGWTRPLDPAGRGWTLHQLRRPNPGGERM
jgi:integrase